MIAAIDPTTTLQTRKHPAVKSLHSLLIVYLGPPLFAAAALLMIVSWYDYKQSDLRPDAPVGVRKGGRIGSEMFR